MGQLISQVITGIVDTTVVPIANVIPVLASTGILFAVFALLWVGLGAGLVWSQGTVDAAWQWVRALPFVVQAVVWVLFLPVILGLWVWETTWPLVVRLVLVAGLAGWNLLVFLPRAAGR
jgi:hypothetical protein